MALPTPQAPPPDTPEAREYNRIRRWLSVADVGIGFLFLLALVGLHWSNRIRDWSFVLTGHSYTLALLAYIAILTLASKLIGLPLDYYSFQIEHRYQLSNEKLGAWIRDEVKEWL